MEDNLIPESEGQCIECKTNPPLAGYPMALCADCRTDFNNYPIPKWLWLFAAGILLLMVTGLIRMPLYFDASVHLRRAEKAIEQHNYITAKREAAKVLKHFPDLIAANAYKLIASAHLSNVDIAGLTESYGALEGKDIGDKDLLEQINEAMNYTDQLIPTDTLLMEKTNNFINYTPVIQENFLDSMDAGVRTSDKTIFGYKLAGLLYDKKDYKTCIAVLNKTLALKPDNCFVMSMLVGAERNAGAYQEALAVCDKILAENSEHVWAVAQKSKLYLLMKQDKKAATFATQAMLLDPQDIAALEVQAMVNYFSGKKPESTTLLAQIRQLEPATGDTTVSERLSKILNGTDTYR